MIHFSGSIPTAVEFETNQTRTRIELDYKGKIKNFNIQLKDNLEVR
jgi:hypothetical protein